MCALSWLLEFENKPVTKAELSYLKFVGASKNLTVIQIDSNQFSVQLSTDENILYTVFTNINMCECISGQDGTFGKHLCAIHEIFFNILIAPTLLTTDRINLATISLGHLSKDDEQFFNNKTWPTTFDNLNKEVRDNILMKTNQ